MAKKKEETRGRTSAADGGVAPVGGDDAAVMITFRMSKRMRDDVERAAKKAGVKTSEWWRQACQAALEA